MPTSYQFVCDKDDFSSGELTTQCDEITVEKKQKVEINYYLTTENRTKIKINAKKFVQSTHTITQDEKEKSIAVQLNPIQVSTSYLICG